MMLTLPQTRLVLYYMFSVLALCGLLLKPIWAALEPAVWMTDWAIRNPGTEDPWGQRWRPVAGQTGKFYSVGPNGVDESGLGDDLPQLKRSMHGENVSVLIYAHAPIPSATIALLSGAACAILGLFMPASIESRRIRWGGHAAVVLAGLLLSSSFVGFSATFAEMAVSLASVVFLAHVLWIGLMLELLWLVLDEIAKRRGGGGSALG